MNKIHTDKAPRAIGPYCQAMTTNGLIFTSGQIPINAESGTIEAKSISEQTEQVCKNLGEVLKAAGIDFDRVVKTTCFITDMSHFAEFNEVYARYFTSSPARSCVAVKELPKGALVEIELIAELN